MSNGNTAIFPLNVIVCFVGYSVVYSSILYLPPKITQDGLDMCHNFLTCAL